VRVLAKVGTHVRSGNPADQIVIDGSDVQKIFGKGALVFLYLEIVLVFRKILAMAISLLPLWFHHRGLFRRERAEPVG